MRQRPDPPRIYALADAEALAPRPLSEGVQRLAAAGVRWIQIRAKLLQDRDLCIEIERCLEALTPFEVVLWINDRADLAAMFPVEGLHVGQTDLTPADARRVVGQDCWIGASTHSPGQLTEAAADADVDVVAVGPVFPTTHKRNPDEVVGLGFVRSARRETDKPLVAIGGIDARRIESVFEAGADSVALLGAVCCGELEDNLARLTRWL